MSQQFDGVATMGPDNPKATCRRFDAHRVLDLDLNPAHVPYWRVNNPTLYEFCFTMIAYPTRRRVAVCTLLRPLLPESLQALTGGVPLQFLPQALFSERADYILSPARAEPTDI
jgi:hypothetical protein